MSKIEIPTGIEAIWAKTEAQTGCTHPLLCHMLETAAVASALWDRVLSPGTHRIVADGLGLAMGGARSWTLFLAASHDLGKASPVFQAKHAPSAGRLRELGYSFPKNADNIPHGRITAIRLREVLPRQFSIPRPIAVALGRMVGGHHGTFSTPAELNESSPRAIGTGIWEEARLYLLRTAAAVLCPSGAPNCRQLPAYSLLAGLVTVSDWIASSERHFPYLGAVAIEPHSYFEGALKRSEGVLASLGWTALLQMPEPLGFSEFFGIPTPRPLQMECIDLAEELPESSMVIIEAPMGEGKTEAALFLAERLRQRYSLRGSFIGLPTQATSNQMFSRVSEAFSHGVGGSVAHLQLLHGHASLSADFEVLRLKGEEAFEPRAIEEDSPGTSSVAAGEWFTHRKRGLLASFGVGTVDQALMAALQSKHVFVRLAGLAGKVVVFDEVHAYDTYMTGLLERLIAWLRAIGCTVVMLSATLPERRRTALLRAFQPDAGGAAGPAPYPCITVATGSGESYRTFLPSAPARTVNLVSVPADPEQVALWLRAQLANGGCAAVVCNTVGRAQEIFTACRGQMPGDAEDGSPAVDLLHSRFPFEEREEREKRSLARFGKPGSANRPARAVLVATQIIEQSLDIDFDLMVTELPPIDLLFQRLGRLHRHVRPARPTGPEARLGILETPVDDDGVPAFSRRQKHVYEEHTLIRTWLALRGRQSVTLPDEIRPSVEAVYGAEWPGGLTEAVETRLSDSMAKLSKRVEEQDYQAEERSLPLPDGPFKLEKLTSMGREDDEELHPFFRALTRLTDQSVTVACLFGGKGAAFLDAARRRAVPLESQPSAVQAVEVVRRTCSVSDRRVVKMLDEIPIPAGWRKSPWLRHIRPVLLDDNGVYAIGMLRLRLSPDLGLMVEENAP